MTRLPPRIFIPFLAAVTLLCVPVGARASQVHRGTDNTATCPVTTLATADAWPWESATYQADHTPTELAVEVLACLQQFFPTTANAAMVALTSLQYAPGRSFENENLFLPTSDGSLVQQPDFPALGIPPLTLEDGPANIDTTSPAGQPPVTRYPNEMALASSWDTSVANEYGSQLGADAAAFNADGLQAPDLNVDRIPNWGRVMETFGEDPVLAGHIGAAETQGILTKIPIVVLKHLGVYGQESDRRAVNNLLGDTALYDTYLRAFAITLHATASSSGVVDMMCAYGDLNGSHSCTSSTLGRSLTNLGFNGIVRTDLATGTATTPLLNAGVSLVKPINLSEFLPYASESPALVASLTAAATRVLAQMFEAGLVSPSALAHAGTFGAMTPSLRVADLAVANDVEERGAVLLKNGATASEGSLPLTSAKGAVTVVTPVTLAQTCLAVASRLRAHGVTATCDVWNSLPNKVTSLFTSLPMTSTSMTRSTTWVAPATGDYVMRTTTVGHTTVSFKGAVLQKMPGLAEHPVETDTTIHAMAKTSYPVSVTWSNATPSVSLAYVQPNIDAAVTATSSARTVVVLAHDGATEAMDRATLELPMGQDALIDALGARRPTSVALFTTGPVTMPWLNTVHSVIEMWNPIGTPTLDAQTKYLSKAYAALLDGDVSPSGHLPITFPASASTSPMNVNNGEFWPGRGGTATLSDAPFNGEEIGYGWYQSANWPVLFPFGYGLTYGGSTRATIDESASCTSRNSATNVCVPVAVRVTSTNPDATRATLEVYVAQPSSVSAPRPSLVLGAATTITCATRKQIAPECSKGTVDLSLSNLDVGEWSDAKSAYGFLPGCYSFVLAPNAATAYSELNTPTTSAGEIIHAVAPFSATTKLLAGACSSN